MEHVIAIHATEEKPGFFRGSIHNKTYSGQSSETMVTGSDPLLVLLDVAKHAGRLYKVIDDATISYICNGEEEPWLWTWRGDVVSLSEVALKIMGPKITPDRMATVTDLMVYATAHQLALVPGVETMQ